MTKARVNADNASADIQGVTAGTGLTGGGTSGTVTVAVDTSVIQARVANVSDTEIGYLDGVTSAIQTQLNDKINNTLTTTTGDIIYASGANTPARLGIGSSGQILSVSSGIPAWTAAPSSGGYTLIASGTMSGATLSLSSIPSTYRELRLVLNNPFGQPNYGSFRYYFNDDQTNLYQTSSTTALAAPRDWDNTWSAPSFANIQTTMLITIPDYASSTNKASFFTRVGLQFNNLTWSGPIFNQVQMYANTSAISSIQMTCNNPNWAGGSYFLYGVR